LESKVNYAEGARDDIMKTHYIDGSAQGAKGFIKKIVIGGPSEVYYSQWTNQVEDLLIWWRNKWL